jgi:hypothetical protein
MVNNSTNINKNHLSPQVIEWWSTIQPISTNITSHFNSFSDWVKVTGDACWYWWNYWPSLNELRWEVIFVDIGGIVDHQWTKISPLFNSLINGQQFHQYQQILPLTSIHWVMVNNSTNINKNHLSLQLIEWWSTIPPISTRITSHFTQWVEVRGNFCWYWWNCWPSLNELSWEVIFVDIGGIVDH